MEKRKESGLAAGPAETSVSKPWMKPTSRSSTDSVTALTCITPGRRRSALQNACPASPLHFFMFLRNHGEASFSILRVRLSCSHWPRPPHQLSKHAAVSSAASLTATVRSTQHRVLCTSSSDLPPTTVHSLPYNWSALAFRRRSVLPATMSSKPSQRAHSGHSHGHHHHHHDNSYLVSKNKNDAGVRITRIGLYVNLGMAIAKGAGGYVFHSQGMPGIPCEQAPVRDGT